MLLPMMNFCELFRKLLLLFFLLFIESCYVTSTVFRLQGGFKLTEGTVLQNVTQPDVTILFCARLCSNSPCNSAAHSRSVRQCLTYSDKIYDTSVGWTTDASWTLLYKYEIMSVVKHGDWTFVMRAQKDTNQSVYDRWLANNTGDDQPVSPDLPIHCYRLDTLGVCPRHFRSHSLDNWTNISQVKFALYTNVTEVNYIVFNGTGTTRNNWFQKSKVLRSSWSSVKCDTSIEYFSIESIYGSKYLDVRRRFVINSYNGCSDDSTYFQTIDTYTDRCMSQWLLNGSNFPKFMYSPLNTSVPLSGPPTAYRFADVMAVFVQ